MPLLSHPLWLVGFRPFFALACAAGALLPIAWVLILGGSLPAPDGRFSATQWHAHEMFFGFGWAVLGGFLLTSTKNWVGIRGYHGRPLLLLALAWLIERLGMSAGSGWPTWLFLLSSNLFLGSIVVLLAWTLIRHHARDSYRDNAIFLVMLPSFIFAKQLILSPEHFAAGITLTLALFRLAFLVMLERTLTQFMKAAFQAEILRYKPLDMGIKLLGLLLVAEPLLPLAIGFTMKAALAGLLLIRLPFWRAWLSLKRIDIGIMFVGYLAIVGQLLLSAFPLAGAVGSLATHVFTVGAMGGVIPSMIVRISKGHTGRKVIFDRGDRIVLYIMLAALLARTLLPQVAPEHYLRWLELTALCWFVGFAVVGYRYIPMLMQARVDGREH